MSNERYIQVGFTALRDPATGEFLPAVPLYIKAEDNAEEAEEQLTHDVGKVKEIVEIQARGGDTR